MSYRQLAKMPPTTVSVHLVLAIDVKTHFAKDVFNRNLPARLTWQRNVSIFSGSVFGFKNRTLSIDSASPMRNRLGAFLANSPGTE